MQRKQISTSLVVPRSRPCIIEALLSRHPRGIGGFGRRVVTLGFFDAGRKSGCDL